MGFRLSPLLWDKVKQGLSAGRVQSVALKMVCDRQAEIDAFISEEYWNARRRPQGRRAAAVHRPPQPHRRQEGRGRQRRGRGAHRPRPRGRPFVVAKVERKESRQKPPPPFITSRLQQEAARRFGFSVKRTMGIAQGLYEGKEIGDRGQIGLITYMRTDSTRVADEAIDRACASNRRHLRRGRPARRSPTSTSSKEGAQDAHEAIRPTSFDLPPDAVRDFLKDEDWKLYKLIWDRFVASQMLPAIFDVTQVDIENGRLRPARLRQGAEAPRLPRRLPRDAGRGRARGRGSGGGPMLPAAARKGEALELVKVTAEQKFTQPPAQFSEATLVKALEENGIGRPSTYATILSMLTDRDYVEQARRAASARRSSAGWSTACSRRASTTSSTRGTRRRWKSSSTASRTARSTGSRRSPSSTRSSPGIWRPPASRCPTSRRTASRSTRSAPTAARS